ncbi:hypothetical protein FBQ74_18195 (plasmid) [Salinimonas iocasae]|uniref:Glycine transporter domain-containing protein n=2 Tax=Salinimonas iocasae TaxID=2572577 RepID=A0A5B7YJJ1_9ALTE|nr:hypothetical protein FBQ74_18195 [Salinimonas iocasae]
MRDVVARKVPLVMRCELYATACIAGGLVFAGLLHINTSYPWCVIASFTNTVSLRLCSFKWGWRILF